MQKNPAFIVHLDKFHETLKELTVLPDMKKILISWWSPFSDFIQSEKGKTVNLNGPNYEVHKYFFDNYEKHILLCSERTENTAFEFLGNTILNSFPKNKLEMRYLALNDISDFFEIKSKVEPILIEHREFQIHLFFTPGTSAMSIVWFLMHQHSGLNSVLFQTFKAEDSSLGKPECKYFKLEKADGLSSFLIRQESEESNIKDTKKEENYFISNSLKTVYDMAYTVAQADRGNILILGDSGTGKEHLASFIHHKSARKKAAFITVNCAAFADTLLESRLFGHRKGSFTGALDNHKGYFEEADRGTIFLDEIGDISPYMQQLLLRVLQNQEIAPIGGKPKKVDVRIVTATNKDLVKLCRDGNFRWDLYYRLATIELEIPSLFERGSKEIQDLIAFFQKKKQQMFGRPKAVEFSEDAAKLMFYYTWPGNVREMENLIERFYLLNKPIIDISDFPGRMRQSYPREDSYLLEDVERNHIEKVLSLNGGNLSKTAKLLGIALNTLKKKLSQKDIENN
jgi:DNA-binding NtrC family response regulator